MRALFESGGYESEDTEPDAMQSEAPEEADRRRPLHFMYILKNAKRMANYVSTKVITTASMIMVAPLVVIGRSGVKVR
jgi:hypothetical protein